jgi:hypothetical protein
MRVGGAPGPLEEIAAHVEGLAATRQPQSLTPEQRLHVRLVLDLVDALAECHGFEPAELVSPRTGVPLGPALARMRQAIAVTD